MCPTVRRPQPGRWVISEEYWRRSQRSNRCPPPDFGTFVFTVRSTLGCPVSFVLERVHLPIGGGGEMNINRRRLLRAGAGFGALSAFPWAAQAQAWPAKPIRVVVAYPAG